MTQINLLPWREIRREKEKKAFVFYFSGAMLLALLVLFAMYLYASQLIQSQTNRNQLLQNEITTLDQQIRKIAQIKKLRQALIARMTIIQNLQETRIVSVHLFDELIKLLPDGVFLTSFERKNNKIVLLGYAESNSSISQLMRNIELNPWVQNPELTEIKKTTEQKDEVDNTFQLSFEINPAPSI